jgi:hypothetical protein
MLQNLGQSKGTCWQAGVAQLIEHSTTDGITSAVGISLFGLFPWRQNDVFDVIKTENSFLYVEGLREKNV